MPVNRYLPLEMIDGRRFAFDFAYPRSQRHPRKVLVGVRPVCVYDVVLWKGPFISETMTMTATKDKIQEDFWRDIVELS